MTFVVKAITRTKAVEYCKLHPHDSALPHSSKYYFALYINRQFMGLSVWGYGILPKQTPKTYFGEAGKIQDYLELCRFFLLNDLVPDNTASKFLSVTHRLIKKHTKVKWLLTYSAGFQGMIGTVYKASGYEYFGKKECNGFCYIPSKNCLIHSVAIYHKWHIMDFFRGNIKGLSKVSELVGEKVYRYCGYNFVYIYWLCDNGEKERLMQFCRHKKQSYPSESELKIWLEDESGFVKDISVKEAKEIKIVKLQTKKPNATIA